MITFTVLGVIILTVSLCQWLYLLLMLLLSNNDIRVILYALTVVKDYHGRFEFEADFLADKIRWLDQPYISISQFKSLKNHGQKAY